MILINLWSRNYIKCLRVCNFNILRTRFLNYNFLYLSLCLINHTTKLFLFSCNCFLFIYLIFLINLQLYILNMITIFYDFTEFWLFSFIDFLFEIRINQLYIFKKFSKRHLIIISLFNVNIFECNYIIFNLFIYWIIL